MAEVIDNKGRIYQSFREFCRENKVSRTHAMEKINKYGVFRRESDGLEAKFLEKSQQEQPKEDKLWTKLKEQYSEKELMLLCKGKGLQDPNLKYPKIHLTGVHHKIGVISDGHLGSKYSPIEFHQDAFKMFEKEKCDCILHCGDVVDGLCPRRADTHIYELSHIGYKQQRDLAIDVFSQCNLPIYCISGNHDRYYGSMGANIVEEICKEVPNMIFIGDDQADIDMDGAILRLFHGGDGSNSYAVSYRLQKLVESYTSGKKPNILLAGHVHKYCVLFERMVHCISVPCLQMQTPWMRGKKLPAHTGFLIIEFDTYNGGVANFKVTLYPFYA